MCVYICIYTSDHLGIQPPEEVKKSVLQALAPLTEEELKIKIRGEDNEEAFYNRTEDDGSFRLRPGMRIQSPSLRCAVCIYI